MCDELNDLRHQYGCTPAQYHAGLDQLWGALGVQGVQDEDVFTLSARRMKDQRAEIEKLTELREKDKRALVTFMQTSTAERVSDLEGELESHDGEIGRLQAIVDKPPTGYEVFEILMTHLSQLIQDEMEKALRLAAGKLARERCTGKDAREIYDDLITEAAKEA